jgi:hypothetical protein
MGPSRPRPDVDAPHIHQPITGTTTRPTTTLDQSSTYRPDVDLETPRVNITDLPSIHPETGGGLDSYLVRPALLRNMQTADDDGFRFVVGRRFVDIKDFGTVHVELDSTALVYRVKDLYNRLPPGPLLLKNPGEPTWSLHPSYMQQTQTPQKRPLPDQARDDGPGASKRPGNLPPDDTIQRPLLGTVYPLDTHYARSYFRIRLSSPADSNGNASYLYGYEHFLNLKRVLLDAPPAKFAGGPSEFTWWNDLTHSSAIKPGPDTQGYHRILIHSRADSQIPDIIYGFKDDNGFLIKVDPPVAGLDARPTHLADWTDYEIWQFYRIHGADIPRFRADAHAAGTRPQWAKPLNTDNPRKDLLNDGLRWLYPQMTRKQRAAQLRTYNLSPAQHATLRQDLIDNPRAMPQWAQEHKLRSQDLNDPTRFDPLLQEIEPLLLPLRYGTRRLKGLSRLHKSVTPEFLDAFATKLGYLRNSSNCLYRTDIPAMFRADERTLFEFVDDRRMLPRMNHSKGATTEKPISVTVGLKLAWEYAGQGRSAPDPDHLRYNNQKNKYPGKRPGEPDNDSGESDNEWPDTSDVKLDSERNYDTIRHDQKITFIYVIDTRNTEVVLREENILLNSSADKLHNNFPNDDNEALLSVSQSGISSDRIWLLDSTNSRAAKIEDVAAQARYSTRWKIEEETHRGDDNRYEYDALIEAAAKAGKPILRMEKGFDTYTNDIVWPE